MYFPCLSSAAVGRGGSSTLARISSDDADGKDARRWELRDLAEVASAGVGVGMGLGLGMGIVLLDEDAMG